MERRKTKEFVSKLKLNLKQSKNLLHLIRIEIGIFQRKKIKQNIKMVIPSTSHKEEVMKLIAKKEQIEQAINDCGHILAANKNIGMNESLLDAEGFPRSDIDVYAVRQARHQIICLQNDLKSTMKEIEQGLISVHAEARTNTATTTKMYE